MGLMQLTIAQFLQGSPPPHRAFVFLTLNTWLTLPAGFYEARNNASREEAVAAGADAQAAGRDAADGAAAGRDAADAADAQAKADAKPKR